MEVNIINLSLWTQAKSSTKFVLFNGTAYPCPLSYLSQWSWLCLSKHYSFSSHPIHSQHSPVILLKLFWQWSQLTFTSSYSLDNFQSSWKIPWMLFSLTVISSIYCAVLIFSYFQKITPFSALIWHFPGSSKLFDLFILVSFVKFFLHSPIRYYWCPWP